MDQVSSASAGDSIARSRDSVRSVTVFAVFILLAMCALFAGAWALRHLLLLTFLAVIFAVLLRASGRFIADRIPVSRPISVILVAVAGVVLVGLAGLFVVPVLIAQGQDLARNYPGLTENLHKRLDDTPLLGRAWEQVKSQFSLPSPGDVMSRAGSVLSVASGALSDLVFLLFTALFLALSPDTYVHGLQLLVPERYRGFTLRLLDELGHTLRAWFGGQLAAMTTIGVLIGLGLWALGVPYALAFGVLAGLLDFIPYLGPILGAVPAILLAFTQSPATALWVTALFLVVQQIEGNVVQPMMQESAVKIPPALLLVVLFGMGELFGLTGLIVATPVLAVTIVAVRRIYVERILEGVDQAGQTAD